MTKKILICDDDAGILDMLELILEDSGHEIIIESNSLNFMRVLDKEKPDLILLDLWMPVLSGDQVLKALRANPHTHSLPVIVISASADGEIIAINAGATEFIPKPFDVNHLLDKVNHYLN